jgi:putative tricarboxylic transport membrane protein
MVKNEWILNLILFLFGVIILFEASRLGLGSLRRPGPGFLPFYFGLLLAVVAFFSFAKNVSRAKRAHWNVDQRFFHGSVFNVAATTGAAVIYVLIFPWLGFLLSTFILLVALFKAAGIRKWTYNLLASFLTVSITYLVFSSWLSIRFQKGIFGF